MGTFIGIGIGLGMNRSSGRNWTPLTLVVEDATPTHVAITFPSAKTVSASDFTIAGFTVLSGSWSGVVYTLVLSVAVVYGDTPSVVYKGVSYPVINNVGWTPLQIPTKIIGWFKESEENAGQQPNKMDAGATHLTVVSGSGLNKVYTLPAGWTAYDTDYCWWKTDASLSTTDGNRLIAYDFARTIIKYDNASPYTLREIIIMAAGTTLTTAEMNHLRDYAWLSRWWDNTLSVYGYLKGNRAAEQSIWTAETVIFPTVSTATIEDAAKANVVIAFNHTLNTSYVPATTDFALAGKTINNVAIVGAVVTLTISVAYAYGDTPTVSYTKPATNYLRDNTTGGAVATFSGQIITNNIGNPATAPTVTTTAISAILDTTSSSGGNVTSDGGASVTVRGVCWNTSANPTTSNSKTTDSSGTGVFTSAITGLTAGTTYHVRAYATNSVGTSYGADMQFATCTLLDTFTGTNGTRLNAHTMEAGAGWTEHNGTTTLQNGSLSQTAVVDAVTLSSADVGKADQDVSLDITIPAVTSYATGILFRFQDTTHYWWAFFENDNLGHIYVVLKCDATVKKTNTDVTGCTTGTVHTLRVVASGNNIKVYFDGGNPIFDITDTTYNDKTRAGMIRYYHSAVSYPDMTTDNFKAI